ncbi:hypothetical protein COV19_05425 [Candidatus Woesearchaeota archaeon CG10_big_fil_rev_8_21_14_0_10_44_13]|nr:MAG: hypothetical protein COV19_05425 [Candidatus Woesearchaeota archaeon CG10_big_fil_rev_8_21_14_0_10_44_13]
MDLTKRLIRNIASLFCSEVVSRFLLFVVGIYLVRYLGAEELGKYTFIIVFVGLFGFIGDLGLSTLLIREISFNLKKTREYLGNFLMIQFILSIIVFFLIIITINVIDYPPLIKKAVYIAASGIFFGTLLKPFSSVLAAYEEMHYMAGVSFLSNLANAIMIIGIIWLKQGLLALSIVFLIFYIFQFLLYALFCSIKCATPKFVIRFELWKHLSKEVLPFFLIMSFGILYNKIDIIMLSKMQGDAAVGYYGAAYKIIDLLIVLSSILGGVIFPVLSKYFAKKDMVSLKKVGYKAIKYLASLSLPIAVGTTLLSARIIIFLFGAEFGASSVALTILIWVIPLQFILGIIYNILLSVKKTILYAKIMGFGVLLNILLNLVLIPEYSYIGASISTLASELTIFLIVMFMVRKHLFLWTIIKDYLPIIFSVLIMAAFIFISKSLEVWAIILLSAAAYFISLYLTKFLKDGEIDLFRGLFFKN